MKAKTTTRKRSRVGRDGMTAMGREIVNALRHVSETLQAGIPLESKYTVRTVEAPNARRDSDVRWSAKPARRSTQ